MFPPGQTASPPPTTYHPKVSPVPSHLWSSSHPSTCFRTRPHQSTPLSLLGIFNPSLPSTPTLYLSSSGSYHKTPTSPSCPAPSWRARSTLAPLRVLGRGSLPQLWGSGSRQERWQRGPQAGAPPPSSWSRGVTETSAVVLPAGSRVTARTVGSEQVSATDCS